MRLLYAHTCEYAGIMEGGKFILAGIFDRLNARRPENGMLGIALPPLVVAAALECSRFEEGDRVIRLRLMNEDGQPLAQYHLPITIQAFDPSTPPYSQVRFHLSTLQVPDFGDYAWEISEGEVVVGTLPFYVRELQIMEEPPEDKLPFE